MDLGDYEINPGVVTQATDKTTCSIKFYVPTMFSANISISELPSAIPFAQFSQKQVLQMHTGEKVWIVSSKINDSEFYYIPMLETNNPMFNFMAGDDGTGIIGSSESSDASNNPYVVSVDSGGSSGGGGGSSAGGETSDGGNSISSASNTAVSSDGSTAIASTGGSISAGNTSGGGGVSVTPKEIKIAGMNAPTITARANGSLHIGKGSPDSGLVAHLIAFEPWTIWRQDLIKALTDFSSQLSIDDPLARPAAEYLLDYVDMEAQDDDKGEFMVPTITVDPPTGENRVISTTVENEGAPDECTVKKEYVNGQLVTTKEYKNTQVTDANDTYGISKNMLNKVTTYGDASKGEKTKTVYEYDGGEKTVVTKTSAEKGKEPVVTKTYYSNTGKEVAGAKQIETIEKNRVENNKKIQEQKDAELRTQRENSNAQYRNEYYNVGGTRDALVTRIGESKVQELENLAAQGKIHFTTWRGSETYGTEETMYYIANGYGTNFTDKTTTKVQIDEQ